MASLPGSEIAWVALACRSLWIRSRNCLPLCRRPPATSAEVRFPQCIIWSVDNAVAVPIGAAGLRQSSRACPPHRVIRRVDDAVAVVIAGEDAGQARDSNAPMSIRPLDTRVNGVAALIELRHAAMPATAPGRRH